MPLPKPPPVTEPRRGSVGDPRYHESPRLQARSASLPGCTGDKSTAVPPMTAINGSDLPQSGGTEPLPDLPPHHRIGGSGSGRTVPQHHQIPPRLPPKPSTSAEWMSPPPLPGREDLHTRIESTKESKHPKSGGRALLAIPRSTGNKSRNTRGTASGRAPPRSPLKTTVSEKSMSPVVKSSSKPEGNDQQRQTRNLVRESKWRVPRETFGSYVVSIQQSPSRFNEQFTALADVGTLQSTNAGKDPLNTPKNLFRNVVPYDHSRVKLTGGESSDYINASYVDGCMSSWGYIACQLPPSSCVVDWWRMIWEKNIIRIVLLESPARTGRAKQHNLWPEQKSGICDYGSFKVHWVEETECDFCVSRKMFIQQEWFRRPIMLYELTTPAFDRSEATVSALVKFHQLIQREMMKDTTKLLVCCRLGAGKTGTFICLDRVVRQLARDGRVEIYHHLLSMRQQRMLLVRNVEEYELIHLCVLHLIKNNMIPAPDESFSADIAGAT